MAMSPRLMWRRTTSLVVPVRRFSAVLSVPVTEELPGIPKLKPARALPVPTTRKSTLSNQLVVATEETYGQVSCVCMFVDAGSQYETPESRGVAHFLENLAFKSTKTKSVEDILRSNQLRGMTATGYMVRELIMYRVEAVRGSVRDAIELLADTLMNPVFSSAEIEAAKNVIRYQIQDLESNAQLMMQDMVQIAAYGDSSRLGHSPMCPVDQIDKITSVHLREYMQTHYRASRMVLAATGVDHDEVVSIAETAFKDLDCRPSVDSLTTGPVSPFVGGDMRLTPADYVFAVQPNPLTHVSIAFPCAGWSSQELVVVCVMDVLLGGGSSFSAGGPGKGMYSRLYREVLNVHHWVEAANAYCVQFTHQGLFGIFGSAEPKQAGSLVNLLCLHLIKLATRPVARDELERALNQLRSSVRMNLEMRAVLCEDIGRQMLGLKRRIPPSELSDIIARVTAADIQAVAQKMLRSPPAFAAYGDCTYLPEYEAIKEYFQQG